MLTTLARFALPLGLVSSATAATVLIDFGATATASGNWNNFTATSGSIALVNTTGASAGNLTIAGALTGYTGGNPTTPPVAYPNTATSDAVYAGAERTITFSNLNTALTYDFTFYGYAARTTSRQTLVTYGTTERLYEPALNGSGGTTAFNGIAPDSTGNIVFTIEPGPLAGDTAGGGGANANFILSAIEITYTVPEPSTALLAAMPALFLLRRRRTP